MNEQERYAHLKELFASVCELPPEDRAEFLDCHCAQDSEMRDELDALLASDDEASGFFGVSTMPTDPGTLNTEQIVRGGDHQTEEDAAGDGNDAAPPRALEPQIGHAGLMPGRIARYEIIRIIGEGGMGVVYLAQQDQPNRTVALKVIKPGLASRELLRRFQHEAEVLGRLQHPGIAQIFDAGTADAGLGPQPYFAMEYIDGAPLDKFAKSHDLGTLQRLALLADICDAIQHAHQKGVIHRDLKPANVLVDPAGRPKVLDFGVARLTDADIQAATLRTDIGQLIGTLPYMSPEQASGRPDLIDTRSDVYALGVMTYVLLAGRLPYDLKKASITEVVRTIEEIEPIPLGRVNRALGGDVETIVAKALDKDPDRRYQSARQFGADIRRYLAHEPITARPASTFYRLRKFARRRRGLFVALSVILALFVGGTPALWILKVQADRATVTAQRETYTANLAKDYSSELLGSVMAAIVEGNEFTVRKLLRRAVDDLDGQFARRPAFEADLRELIGRTYRVIGDFEDAEANLDRALTLSRQLYGNDDKKTVRIQHETGILRLRQGRRDEAVALFEQTLELRTRLLGADAPDTLEVKHDLGAALSDVGDLARAEPLIREVLARYAESEGLLHQKTLMAANTLGVLLHRRAQVARDPATSDELQNQALEVFRRNLANRREVLGVRSLDTVESMGNLAEVLREQGELDQAAELMTEALDIRRTVEGEDHPNTLVAMNNLAILFSTQDKLEEAAQWFARIVEARQRRGEADHPDALKTAYNLAKMQRLLGRFDQAEALLRETLKARRSQLGEGHLQTLHTANELAAVLGDMQRWSEAIELMTATVQLFQEHHGRSHQDTLFGTFNLAYLYQQSGAFAEAESWYRSTIAAADGIMPSDHWFPALARARLGYCLVQLDRYADAEEQLLPAFEALRQSQFGPEHENTIAALESIIALYEAWGRTGQARAYRARLPVPEP